MHMVCRFECPAWGYERPTAHFSFFTRILKHQEKIKYHLQQQCSAKSFPHFFWQTLWISAREINKQSESCWTGKHTNFTAFVLRESDQEKSHLKKLTKISVIPELWYLKLGIQFIHPGRPWTWEHLGFGPFRLNEWLDDLLNNNNKLFL